MTALALLGWLATLSAMAGETPAATPPAAVEAPGELLPLAGRSLFDILLGPPGPTGEAVVPFPFAALLGRIRAELDANQASGGLTVVLIPLGRSLQRPAVADTQAFRQPRVVAAVTGEPPAAAAAGHLYLKDRLYIGYHEGAAALEVISYNETAGRFEFQVVRNYRADARPTLGYANRELCLACHQNAAPIFSRASWDETAASPPVAARLAATGQPYYGIAWRHGVDLPDAIDAATARANQFTLAQRLWREGCAAATRAVAIACRAEALRVALRYRLGGGRAMTLDTPTARSDLLEPLLSHWRARWPSGLPLPDPQLPNRQPFSAIDLTGVVTAALPSGLAARRIADIGAAFDPLALRPPLAIWRGQDSADVARFVHALSLFFSQTDIRLLDRQLAAAPAASLSSVTFICRERVGTARLDFDCDGAESSRLLARLSLHGGLIATGSIDRLSLPGADHSGPITLDHGTPGDAAGISFTLGEHAGGVRSARGESIRRLWLTRGRGDTPATARLELVADLAPLDAAIDALAQTTLAGHSDAFDARALRRDALLAPIFARLGVPLPVGERPPLPPARLADDASVRDMTAAADLLPFVQQCGLCHGAASRFPPGFLHGDDSRVRANLAECAERILYRLQMNRLTPAAQLKTPMPPPAAAHAPGFAQSADLPAMLSALETLTRARGGLGGGAVLKRPYPSLAPCVPPIDPDRGERR
ncbi:hypothetical protein NVV94_18815 [Pseudomonas sp. LS1212]|uniref:hypothetical protein n=1 Tax=Pseudomonas sp. LS1212 TaxID=2972478 RepID=UPI00215C1834|nr:hypothetical protein [Pseudomonas sp. LS1212]UVJ42655.1 hypothetical protein NVV94_18815 [Pseudomonas sp. LS1212]